MHLYIMMTTIKRIAYLTYFLLFVSVISAGQSTSYGVGFDFRLFEKTPVYQLAKAVETDDTAAIKRILARNKLPIDYRERKYGNSLLSVAVVADREGAVAKLLRAGANPNARSFDGSSPFLKACFYGVNLKNPIAVLKMLIDHGADVNSVQVDTTTDQFGHRKNFRRSGLRMLIYNGSLPGVRLLVDKGVKLNAYGRNDSSLVSYALLIKDLDIARYFLIEKKLPVPDYVIIRQPGFKNEKKMTLTDMLNERDFAQDEKNQRLKAEILAFLRSKGKV